MSNFKELIMDILNEKGLTKDTLEENKIIGKNSFYEYKYGAPSLITTIKISNFLHVSVDYLLGLTTENKFSTYSLKQAGFYNNLSCIMKTLKISQAQMSIDLHFSRTNFSRWKNDSLPSLPMLVEISKYLNCLIDELLEHEDNNGI